MSVDKLYRYEIVLLSLLVLVLPSLEALKTFFWFSYLCIYLLRHYREGNLSLYPAQPVTIAISLLLLAALASTLVNWPIDNGFKGFIDEFRFATLFLCLYCAGYSKQQYRFFAMLVVVGVLGGLVYGLVEFLSGMRSSFQFHSAGVVTQSSIYLGIAIMLNTGLLLDNENTSPRLSLFLKAALLIQIIALLSMGSRGSMLAVALCFLLLAILTLRSKAIVAWVAGIATAALLVAGLIQMFPESTFSKEVLRQYSSERIEEADSQRIAIWEISFAKLATGEDLPLGIGPRNYKALKDMEFLRNNDQLVQLDKYNHAHNIFLTQLVEQGVLGLLAMLSVFLLFLLKIISAWRAEARRSRSPRWAWYGGLGALAVPVIAGMFNTPYYQEHAMLSMLVTGMLFAFYPVRNKPAQA